MPPHQPIRSLVIPLQSTNIKLQLNFPFAPQSTALKSRLTKVRCDISLLLRLLISG